MIKNTFCASAIKGTIKATMQVYWVSVQQCNGIAHFPIICTVVQVFEVTIQKVKG
jgi:hypothetical protein